MSESAVPVVSGRRATAVIAVLAASCTLAAMMQSLIMPLLIVLPRDLGTTPGALTWAVTATLLMGGVCTPIAGRVGDLIGKRRVVVACMIPPLVGSVVCALSASLVPMIVGRALQGVGISAIPVAIALLRDLLPAHRLSSGIALLSASMGVGGSLAVPISAFIAQSADWHALFWASAAACLVCGVLTSTVVPGDVPGAAGQRFDAFGALGLAAGLVCLLLAISEGGTWGWTDPLTLIMFGAAVAVLLGWGVWELRCAEPLIDLRSTARPRVLLTNVASIFAGMAMYITLLTTTQILMLPRESGVGLGASMVLAGLLMLPGGVVQMFLSPVSGKIIDSRGPKTALIVGVLVIGLGYSSMQALLGSMIGLMIGHMIIKAGIGVAYGSMPALIMRSVPVSETGAANSFNTLMRSIGTTTGAAVIGAILTQMLVTNAHGTFISEAGFRSAYAVGLGCAVIAGIIAAAIPKADAPDRAVREVVEKASARPAGVTAALESGTQRVRRSLAGLGSVIRSRR